MTERAFDVAIVGGGPAGLSAAMELREMGIASVLVLEREAEAGGIPRHCAHPPFGLREFGRLMTGPSYARRLVAEALKSGVELQTRTTVTGIADAEGGYRLHLSTPAGMASVLARRVIIATGVRETPRSARLTTGERPLGVINTGALQSYTVLEHLAPFRRPVIVGSELVSLSAILTCRKIGAYPVAMIEEGEALRAPSLYFLYPRALGMPVMAGTRIVDIIGRPRVNAVIIEDSAGRRTEIACDGVIFSGRFTPDIQMARAAELAIDKGTGGPDIDQFGRTSRPGIFAAGNLLRPVETAGWSFREGRRIARAVAADLSGGLPAPGGAVIIETGTGIRYAVPQRLVADAGGLSDIQLRIERGFRGTLAALGEGGETVWRGRLRSGPERRILVPREKLGTTLPRRVRFELIPD